jgi:arylsulfatase A-like enzyme
MRNNSLQRGAEIKMNKAKKPFNIVWLIQDHVTWKHYQGTTGPKPELRTYDRIVARGTDFNKAYTVVPLCGPARGSLLTGVYPHKHGIITNGVKLSLQAQKDSNTGTFNSYLLEQGYRTAHFGKWHAGNGIAQDCDFEGYSLPGYGNPYGSPEYAAYLKQYNLPEPIVDIEWTPYGEPLKNVRLMEKGIDPSPTKGIGHTSTGILKTPKETAEAFFLSKLASNWLEKRAEDGDPFVLRVDLWGPHHPYLVAEPFKDSINPKEIPEYPNFHHDFSDRPDYHKRDREEWRERTGHTTWAEWQPIVARAYEHFSLTDAALGEVLDTLERTGLLDNTIVIYTADHGDILASNGGLFDKDSMLTEETMSIPLAISWPGVTKGDTMEDVLVCNMDIVPTVLEMAGLPIPAHMDGKSLVSLLKGTEEGGWREDLMAEHFGHKNHHSIQRVLYWENYKYVAHLDDSDELYDLKEDPFELKNLILEPLLKPVLNQIQGRLASRMKEFDDLSDDSKKLMLQKQMM